MKSVLIKYKEVNTLNISNNPNYKNHDLVIAAKNGNYLEPRNLIRKFKELIQKAIVPSIPFHNLRLTHATILMYGRKSKSSK